MKYLLPLFMIIYTLHATKLETNTTNIENTKVSPVVQSEYIYLQPVSIEIAPPKKVVPKDDDKDGVGNLLDNCPNTPLGIKVDSNGCEIIKDTDKDGVSDKNDKCPNTSFGIKVDKKGCELDSDEDGVVDSKDQCPDTSKDFVVDGYGCPQTATLYITFESGKSNISDTIIDELKDFAKFLQDNKGYQVVIYGYTDSKNRTGRNKILSQERANTVLEALKRYGIKGTRLTAIGKGSKDPIADNSTKEGRAKNRRIEIELIQ